MLKIVCQGLLIGIMLTIGSMQNINSFMNKCSLAFQPSDKIMEQYYRNFIQETDDVVYIYVPGSFGSAAIAGKYTIEYKHHRTGEIIRSKNGMQVFGKNVVVVDGSEVINRTNETSLALAERLWHKVCHVITRNYRKKFGITVESGITNQNTLGESIAEHAINPFRYVIGLQQDKDAVIALFNWVVQQSCYKGKKIVIYGHSRGTVAILYALVELQHHEHFNLVKAIVLEGCFDSLEHIYSHHKISRLVPFDIITKIAKKMTGVDQKINRPIDVISELIYEKIPPLLLIGSYGDGVINHTCAQRLFDSFSAKLKNIRLLLLKQSGHTTYMFDNNEDRMAYFNAVHSLYKDCDLPYISTF